MRPASLRPALATTLLLASGVQATSYEFTGPTYNSIANNTTCTVGTCGSFSGAMRSSGVFTTLAPLANNLVNADVTLLVTSFSVSSGLDTITSMDPGRRIIAFQVSTDASGQITDSFVRVQRWQDNLAGAHGLSDRLDLVGLEIGAYIAAKNWGCLLIGVGPAGESDVCLGANTDSNTSIADYPAGGTWASVPDITINDVSANEGNSGTNNFSFTVSLSAIPATPVSVVWATADGSATAGSDYTAASGTLSWLAGDGGSRTITVQVPGDATVEGNETFSVRLSKPSGAGIADIAGEGTITNDDLPPPDLILTKTDGAANTAPGATVAYTLTCANSSGQAASGVTLTETVPANTTFNAGASTAGWACLPNANAGSTCTYAVGGLAVWASQATTFAVTIASPLSEAVTQIVNTASCADDGAHGADPVPANNSATDTDTVVHPQVPPVMGNIPDQTATLGTPFTLSLSAFVGSTNGDAITGYTLASGALPPGLTFNPGTGAISGTPTAAGIYQITVTASDNDGASAADAIQFTVSAASPSSVSSVPTLSEWALMLLAGLMALVTLGDRRRHG